MVQHRPCHKISGSQQPHPHVGFTRDVRRAAARRAPPPASSFQSAPREHRLRPKILLRSACYRQAVRIPVKGERQAPEESEPSSRFGPLGVGIVLPPATSRISASANLAVGKPAQLPVQPL